MGDTYECGISQVARRQHAGWQVGSNAALDLGELGEPLVMTSESLKIKVRLP
ncbi:hypothetical protein ES707_22103 [subsurface metagenome]